MPSVGRESHRVVPRLGIARAALLLAGVTSVSSTWAAAPATAEQQTTKAKAKGADKAGKSKKAPRKKKSAEAPAPTEMARRRIGAPAAYVVGDSDAHLINESAPPIVPFPEDSKAVKKAFDETRRDQLVDAEKAARDAKSPDRWRSVLFALRGLPERADPEACFWRVLSFYRLGEITRARALREGCELPSKDSVILNGEDATASGIPQIGTVPPDDGFGPPPDVNKAKAAPKPTPALTAAAYAGPSPQRK